MNEYGTYSGQTDPLLECEDDLFSVLELFPIPMEVFSKEGMSLFVNKAFIEFFHINTVDIIGKFNVLEDSYINNKIGLADYLRRVFSGEILSCHDIEVPFKEIKNLYTFRQREPVRESIYQDITCFPLRNQSGSAEYIIALFMTKHIYQLQLEAAKAKEYIDNYWLDDFDMDKIAKHANVSRYHLARVFKKFFGITPYSYYQEVKIENIKKVLCDDSTTIGEAFTSCGVDYNSAFAKAFKFRIGMTPTQYRSTLSSHTDKQRISGIQDKTKDSLEVQSSSFCTMADRLFHIAELFPIPIQIFKPDGDIVFINEAVLRMWNVRDTDLILGKYNLLRDSFVNDEFGLRNQIRRTFQGEVVLIPDIRVPLENFWEWYKTRSTVYDIDSIYTDILNFPVWGENKKIMYIVSIFLTSRIYSGRPEVAKAREYIENHWRDELDIAKLAKTVNLSPPHLVRLFKNYTGMTPYGYYQEIKTDRLKAALRDRNLSVMEAFISCGFEQTGNFTRYFKKKAGMTPSQYRKSIENK